MKITIKLRVFSDQLFERRHEGGGGGCTGGLMGRGGQQCGGGGGGVIVGRGSTVGVSSTFKNRPSHHKYKSPKQFELKKS